MIFDMCVEMSNEKEKEQDFSIKIIWKIVTSLKLISQNFMFDFRNKNNSKYSTENINGNQF